MGNLSREFVERQGGNEANYTVGNLHAYRDQVGVSERRQTGKTKKATTEACEFTGVAHAVEGLGVNTKVDGVLRSEHPSMTKEYPCGPGPRISACPL